MLLANSPQPLGHAFDFLVGESLLLIAAALFLGKAAGLGGAALGLGAGGLLIAAALFLGKAAGLGGAALGLGAGGLLFAAALFLGKAAGLGGAALGLGAGGLLIAAALLLGKAALLGGAALGLGAGGLLIAAALFLGKAALLGGAAFGLGAGGLLIAAALFLGKAAGLGGAALGLGAGGLLFAATLLLGKAALLGGAALGCLSPRARLKIGLPGALGLLLTAALRFLPLGSPALGLGPPLRRSLALGLEPACLLGLKLADPLGFLGEALGDLVAVGCWLSLGLGTGRPRIEHQLNHNHCSGHDRASRAPSGFAAKHVPLPVPRRQSLSDHEMQRSEPGRTSTFDRLAQDSGSRREG